MKINSKLDLKTYVKTKLGDGYTQIVDISDISYNDAIDDAVSTFVSRVYESSEESFIEVPVVKGTVSYKMPSNVLTAIKILDTGIFSGSFSAIQGYSFVDAFAQVGGYQGMDLTDYVLFNNQIETYNKYLNDEYTYSYNSIYNNLKIFKMPANATSVIVHCYTTPEEESLDYACIYNHEWVKKRVYANVLERWYIAYLKSTGDLFDGNVAIDKQAIKQEYSEKLEESEQELEDIYTGMFGALYK